MNQNIKFIRKNLGFTQLNNKIIELYKQLLHEGRFKNQKAFCDFIDYEEPSFSHVLSNRRSFPKTKIPILVTQFNLPRDYFSINTYSGQNDICEKITHIRKLKNMTQREFAKEIGVTQAAISAIENKVNKEPSFTIFWGLINKLKVNPFFLFSNDQIVFDNQKKFGNRAKIDQVIMHIKKTLDELNSLSI